ncbi:filamentous hemagglutinin family N-terminal domain-containing protein [Solimonas aquatica]|uniref:Filamentous hemagglutinin family N-terminal domain-containing protein n=1 Tax=Solimonas aquatica TaxID=489703 RepID=A0A1H9DLY7_9GAMM|nr:filamentous haemagglutinin family protein [Solimonas aquatica]SEQ14439.1 filamentous hemagglutinin family N-terminal domain-containing protein [Solimonas aquatica]
MKRPDRQQRRPGLWPLSAQGRMRRIALLGLLGAPSLLQATPALAGASIGSAAWFAQMHAGSAAQNQIPATRSPTTAVLQSGASTPDQALKSADRSLSNLRAALDGIAAEKQRQLAAAQQLSLEAPAVPDGLTAGGLVPSKIEVPQASGSAGCASAAQCIWVNAEAPTQAVQDGRTTVTVAQTADKAVLTWDSFNVGAHTTLHIDQHAGTQSDGKNDWIALNRVRPGVEASVVQGTIKAEGAVYILNQNGVLFDAGSRIDTHSLLVSTLPLYLRTGEQKLRDLSDEALAYSNTQFLKYGLLSTDPNSAIGGVLGLNARGGATLPLAAADALSLALPGDVTVARGAQLSIRDDGFGLIAAPNVHVAGVLDAADSQLALVAGVGVEVSRPDSSQSSRRFVVNSVGRIVDASHGNAELTPLFTIDNSGLISALRGGVSLIGSRVLQDGVIEASTSVARAGYIDIIAADGYDEQSQRYQRYGYAGFSGRSLTTVLPDEGKSGVFDHDAADDTPDKTNSSASADAQFAPQGLNVKASAIVLDSGALLEAPGQNVNLTAVAEDSSLLKSTVDASEGVAGRLYIAPGASIDVSGLADIEVPLSEVLISVPRIGLNELADSPLQRSGPLFGSSLVFDSRDSGTRSDGVSWVGTPLANLLGYVENVSRGVRELLVNGGNLKLLGNEVIADIGSQLNLAGGYLHYDAGYSNATRLVTASGGVVDIAHADPNVRYVGFAGQAVEQHPRWNISEVYINPLLSGKGLVYEEADIGGGNAGSLTVFGQTTSLIAGSVDAHAVSGRRQLDNGGISLGGTLQWGGNFSGQLFPGLNTVSGGPSYAVVSQLDSALLRGVDARSPAFERGGDASDTGDVAWWTPVSAKLIRDSGASVVKIIADQAGATTMGGEIKVAEDAQLSVAPGGSAKGDNGLSISAARIEMVASRIDVEGQLSAPSGRINLLSTGQTYLEGASVLETEGDVVPGDIVLGDKARLSARGLLINDTDLDQQQAHGSAYLNGGSVTLSTLQSSFVTDPGSPAVEPDPNNPDDTGTPEVPPTVANLTGAIVLNSGSVIDVMSGLRVQQNGRLQRSSDGVILGSGGSIALSTYLLNGAPFGRVGGPALPSTLLDEVGHIELGGALYGYGFQRGGRLALRAPGIVIDGSTGSDAQGTLAIDPALFSAGGRDAGGRPVPGGFADFRLDAVYDAGIASNTRVLVSPQQWLLSGAEDAIPALRSIGSGSDLLQLARAGAITIGRLDAFHTRSASFALYAGDYLNWVGGESGGIFVPPSLLDEGGDPLATGSVLIDTAATLAIEPRSSVVIASHNRVTLLGSIIDHGGSVTLSVDTASGGYHNNPSGGADSSAGILNPYTSDDKWVLLGAESLIDVSGTTLYDTTTAPAGSGMIPVGEVIDGGSVTLSADTGYVIALSCADTQDCSGSSSTGNTGSASTGTAAGSNAVIPKFGSNDGGSGGSGGSSSGGNTGSSDGNRTAALIDVSGASGYVGILQPCLRLADATLIASDAGAIRIGAGSGLYFDGSLLGQAGGAGAQGGSLSVVALNPRVAPDSGYAGAQRLVLSATAPTLPERFLDFSARQTVGADGILYFSTDRLDGSGIAALSLGSDPQLSDTPVPIDINSSLSLSLARSLSLNTLVFSARPPVPEHGHIKPIEVSLSAPYVALHGYSASADSYDSFENITVPGLPETRQPLSSLSISAQDFDIGGQLAIENYKDVALNASGDVRFYTPAAYSSFNTGNGNYKTLPGVLLIGGSLTLTANRIYPASGQTQLLIADNHLRRSDLELIIRPTEKDPDTGEPLTTFGTLYQASDATITFKQSGGSSVAPYSVGGSLVVTAKQIEQDGTIYAPGGSIQLGIANDHILEGVDDDEQVFNYSLFPYFRSSIPTVQLDAVYHYDDLVYQDPTDTRQAVLQDQPLITQVALETITSKVSFGAGSRTSVSLAGLTLPYGQTVDGLNLVYNPSGDSHAQLSDLKQSPDKRIGVVGGSIDVKSGAVLDVSGGGELFASEWVAGTGGTRNVLASSSTSFAGGVEHQLSLYPDARQVYAIVPGYSGLAPYDPALLSGDLARDPLVGQAVYLSGIAGLPAGTYTLLPGAYAVLPGAYRLVQDTATQDVIASISNKTLADGSLQVAGYFVDQLSGARSAHSSNFLLQSAAVWGQYSEYHYTSLNHYFTAQQSAGALPLAAPADAGTLALSTLTQLSLSGALQAAPVSGYKGVDLQIAAPQIVVGDGSALGGALSLDAAWLSGLHARRLLLGALSGSTADGIEELYVGADKVTVANSAARPLQAAEIVLVARGESAGDGVQIGQQALLRSEGAATGRRGYQLSIGGAGTIQHQTSDPDDGTLSDDEPIEQDVSGDGAFLQLSVNQINVPVRLLVTGLDGPEGLAKGSTNIVAGATLGGAGSLTLDATGGLAIADSAQLKVQSLGLNSADIAVADRSSLSGDYGVLIGPALQRQLAQIGLVQLNATQAIHFIGDAQLRALDTLELNSPELISDGGHATLSSGTLILANNLDSAAGYGSGGTGQLTAQVSRLEFFGDHSLTGSRMGFDGFAQLSLNAGSELRAVGSGSLLLGGSDLLLQAPVFNLGNASALRIEDAGLLQATRSSTSQVPAGGVGGSLGVTARRIDWNAPLAAQAGRISLSASEDLRLGAQAQLDARGSRFIAYDQTLPLSAGSIQLASGSGALSLAAGATLDVSADASGGDAGAIALSSAGNAVSLQGQLRGARGSSGAGASFSLDSRSAVALDGVADALAGSGIDGAIRVRSGSGDLSLGADRQLRAQSVQLIADGGDLDLAGRIDARGADGGSIAAYAQHALRITGSLLAAGGAQGKGGRIDLGVGASGDGRSDALLGYQSYDAAQAGRVQLADTALLDVSGSAGRVRLRVPLLADGSVPLSVADGATLLGASTPELEIYARWDAADSSSGALHFNGRVDPANSGDAGRFFRDTLVHYVQSPVWQLDQRNGQAQHWLARAGIELRNSSALIDGGDITIASNWNLASGHFDAQGRPVLDLRTNDLAPVISLRASGDLRVQASISDGFFQSANPFNPTQPDDLAHDVAASASASNPLPLATASLLGLQADGRPYDSASLRLVAGADTGSADPLALLASSGKGSVVLSGHQSAASNAAGNEGRMLATPTMIRTGVGSIEIAAARDLLLSDSVAPGVIYTAGYANTDGLVRPGNAGLLSVVDGQAPVIDTGKVQPRGAGDLDIAVGGSIRAPLQITDDGTRTGVAGANLTQWWWPWMQDSCLLTQSGCTGSREASSINFGMFDQGVLSAGGDVRIRAGGDIQGLSVSLPSTWTKQAGADERGIGGGDLQLSAGGDVLGGSYFVAKGEGHLRAGGVFGNSDAAPLLALQDAQLKVEAAAGLNVGGIFNPSYLFTNFDANAYSAASAVSLRSAAGAVVLGSAAVIPGADYGGSSVLGRGDAFILPAHLSIAAANGTLSLRRGGELFPAADGQLELYAQDSISLLGRANNGERLGLLDLDAALLPSIDSPLSSSAVPASGSFIQQDGLSNFLLRDPGLLHAHDPQPLRLYSVAGSILNGYRLSVTAGSEAFPGYEAGAGDNGMRISVFKPAQIRAGLDIVNLWFSGQNFYSSDITSIIAGRDLLDPPLQQSKFVPVIELGGPGSLAVSAGRNLGPLTSAGDARSDGYLFKGSEQFPGIRSIGNSNNLYLDRDGADIDVAYGVGPGIAIDAFAAQYLDPAVLHDPLNPQDKLGTPDYTQALLAFVRETLLDAQRRDGVDRSVQLGALDASLAWQIFSALPQAQRQRFVSASFLDLLNQVGLDYNAVTRKVYDRSHPQGVQYSADNILYAGQYGRGYRAIDTLFPGQWGYTQNALDGSRNGALALRSTGTLDMRGSTIQSRYGGSIDILGPGGPILVGSAGAPPFTAETGNTAAVGPSSQGVLALQAGSVRVFTDQSVLLAQSRIFTQQGGDVLIWSSNGDINAGKGAKTSSEVPPLRFACDDDLFCTVDTASQVSGAGIAALQSVPGEPAGSANLIAPVGTVDAGDAGIRVSGSLNVAAAQVANADNIQVSGAKIGVPSAAVDSSAMSVAGAVSSAVAQSAEQAGASQKRRDTELELFVEILSPVDSGSDCTEQDRKQGACGHGG